MTEEQPTKPSDDVKPVPEELLRQLHEANAEFSKSREQVEGAMDGTEYRHQERVNQAEAQLRGAEHDVEDVERRIQDELKKPS